MLRTAPVLKLEKWLDKAAKAKTIYHREREQLWDSFTTLLAPNSDISIPVQIFNSIKGFLICRNDRLTDDKELSYITAIEELTELVSDFNLNQPQPAEDQENQEF